MAFAIGVCAGIITSAGLARSFAPAPGIPRFASGPRKTHDTEPSMKSDMLTQCVAEISLFQRELWNHNYLSEMAVGSYIAGFTFGFTAEYVRQNRRARLIPTVAGAMIGAVIYVSIRR